MSSTGPPRRPRSDAERSAEPDDPEEALPGDAPSHTGAIPSPDPDQDVFDLVRARKIDAALSMLMKRHGDAVYRYCRESLRDAALAEDVQQRVFIEAYRDLRSYAGRSTLRSWLFGIARHRVLDAAKARRRQDAPLDRRERPDVPDSRPAVDERIDDARLNQALRRCLEEVGEHVRRDGRSLRREGRHAAGPRVARAAAAQGLHPAPGSRLVVTDDPSLQRIEKAIAELGQEYRSPPGWEDRVRAAVRRRRPVRWAAIGAVVAAAAAVLLWWSVPGGRAVDSRPAFESQIKRGDVRVRGDSSARLGDTLLATVRGGKHRAMWLYRNDRLSLRCPGPTGCASSDRVLSLDVPLDLLGRYTLIGLRHDAPLPVPQGDLDADLAAAQRAGVSAIRKSFVVE
jgi:RNA polymerase sigma factor (sigma-70 family)